MPKIDLDVDDNAEDHDHVDPGGNDEYKFEDPDGDYSDDLNELASIEKRHQKQRQYDVCSLSGEPGDITFERGAEENDHELDSDEQHFLFSELHS